MIKIEDEEKSAVSTTQISLSKNLASAPNLQNINPQTVLATGLQNQQPLPTSAEKIDSTTNEKRKLETLDKSLEKTPEKKLKRCNSM